MKLRAIIFGVQEYEEFNADYPDKSDVSILSTQVTAGIEDPISFCTPDNVNVKVESVDHIRYSEADFEYAKSMLRKLYAPNVPVEALKDDRLRAHWAAARFHLNELERLLGSAEDSDTDFFTTPTAKFFYDKVKAQAGDIGEVC